ncbi:MAG: tRNA (guanosine(37)-N1)-methyltransferase TrmD [Patescibacteria group bacterium]|nr:tRNA (guanosine(37)-N1)-methyltransferase TrmD [Patescibacteria group bacterium]MDD5534197.1 tRNA (guanosine(37)-N1)-methyltransferase TrmD [Patescibacteria group bacterium]
MKFDILTIFPDIFENYFNASIIKRAREKKLIKIKVHNFRSFTADKHKKVDDKPYGGGPGMILKIEPLYNALTKLKFFSKTKNQKIILFTPEGKKFDQKMARRLSKLERIILICGRYEGVDARIDKFIDEKISIGDYVLTGGELPAMILVDAITRLIPGVIRQESLKEESFGDSELTTEYPQYTRPEVFTFKDKFSKIKKLIVPKELLSGNHQKIEKWRQKHFGN